MAVLVNRDHCIIGFLWPWGRPPRAGTLLVSCSAMSLTQGPTHSRDMDAFSVKMKGVSPPPADHGRAMQPTLHLPWGRPSGRSSRPFLPLPMRTPLAPSWFCFTKLFNCGRLRGPVSALASAAQGQVAASQGYADISTAWLRNAPRALLGWQWTVGPVSCELAPILAERGAISTDRVPASEDEVWAPANSAGPEDTRWMNELRPPGRHGPAERLFPNLAAPRLFPWAPRTLAPVLLAPAGPADQELLQTVHFPFPWVTHKSLSPWLCTRALCNTE